MRNRFLFICLYLILSILLLTCNQSKEISDNSNDKDILSIRNVIHLIDSLSVETNLDFLNYYENDAIWMYPWDFQDNFKEDAYKFYKKLLEDRPEIFKNNTGEIHEIKISGEFAFLRVTFRRPPKIDESTGKALRGGSRHMMILRKQIDGSWKVYRDIFNNPRPTE